MRLSLNASLVASVRMRMRMRTGLRLYRRVGNGTRGVGIAGSSFIVIPPLCSPGLAWGSGPEVAVLAALRSYTRYGLHATPAMQRSRAVGVRAGWPRLPRAHDHGATRAFAGIQAARCCLFLVGCISAWPGDVRCINAPCARASEAQCQVSHCGPQAVLARVYWLPSRANVRP